ncbi:hypothetical protein DFH27DRAFT_557425, partial [Peziza echinospora]
IITLTSISFVAFIYFSYSLIYYPLHCIEVPPPLACPITIFCTYILYTSLLVRLPIYNHGHLMLYVIYMPEK